MDYVTRLLSLLTQATTALADTTKIQTGIPGPLDPQTTGILGFIQNAYLFALGIAGLLALGSIVYGAIQYSVSRGNASQLNDAWDRIIQAFIGILLLVGAGTLLSIINPGLLSLELPNLAPVTVRDFKQSFESEYNNMTKEEFNQLNEENPAWRRPPGGGGCRPDTSNKTLCGVDNMRRCSAWNATEASAFCSAESRGDAAAPSGVDRCTNAYGDRRPVGFSMGLMQINLIAHNAKLPAVCKNLFTGPSGRNDDMGAKIGYTASGVPNLWSCRFNGDFARYQQCRDAFRAEGGKLAIQMACTIYDNQSAANKWKPWPHTAKSKAVCGYPDYRSHPERY